VSRERKQNRDQLEAGDWLCDPDGEDPAQRCPRVYDEPGVWCACGPLATAGYRLSGLLIVGRFADAAGGQTMSTLAVVFWTRFDARVAKNGLEFRSIV
jgi:hypothetical protein